MAYINELKIISELNEKENSKKEEKDKKIKDLEGGVMFYLGSLYKNMGNLPKAEEFYVKSLKIRQNLFGDASGP